MRRRRAATACAGGKCTSTPWPSTPPRRRWRAQFDALWPAGSDAQASYGKRIARGPDYGPEQALLQLR